MIFVDINLTITQCFYGIEIVRSPFLALLLGTFYTEANCGNEYIIEIIKLALISRNVGERNLG